MQREPAAEQEDEEVVHDPVVEAVHEEGLQQRAVGQAVDVGVEADAIARPVVEGDLQDHQPREAFWADALYPVDPERHEQVEPQEDHEEVELVFRRAEEQQPAEPHGVRETRVVEDTVVQDVEDRPHEVGDEHGLEALLEEEAIVELRAHVEVVEEAEGRDEEENRYAEARDNLHERHEMDIGRGIDDVLRADVNRDDTDHGDAADVLDGGEARLAPGSGRGRGLCS